MNSENVDKQPEIKPKETREDKIARIKPHQWRPGQSGNPKGRPKGKTMKEYVRELLECQTDEERQEFLKGIDKNDIWKMAEGSPAASTDITSKGEKIMVLPAELIVKHDTNTSPITNS